jgi:hypothetical protein
MMLFLGPNDPHRYWGIKILEQSITGISPPTASGYAKCSGRDREAV